MMRVVPRYSLRFCRPWQIKKPSHEEAKPSLRTRMSNQIAERHRKGSKSFQNRSHANENGGSGTSVEKQKSRPNIKMKPNKKPQL